MKRLILLIDALLVVAVLTLAGCEGPCEVDCKWGKAGDPDNESCARPDCATLTQDNSTCSCD
jgi:hypothetical protein